MNDYIFFEADLAERFLAFAQEQGIAGTLKPDPIEGVVVGVPDLLPDDIESAIEARYDELMIEQQQRIEDADGDDRTVMGVELRLADGSTRLIRVPAAYGRRLCQHFTSDEIHDLMTAVAESLLDPVDGPLCRGACDSA